MREAKWAFKHVKAGIAGALIGMVVGVHPSFAGEAEDTGHSVREQMENMQPGERYTFVSGIVEGIAFHRYTAGNKDADAMNCVYDWFYKGHNGQRTIDVIYAAFGEYPDYPPAAVVAALAKRKCPE